MGELNREYLGEAHPTDVLSFSIDELDLETGAFHLGEIVAGFETAAREAQARGLPLEEELARYVLHGFLHLLGYDDRTAAQRRALEQVQETVLAGL